MAKQPPSRTLRSGELAAMAGISRDALRYYERHGLMPSAQRTGNGYRVYQTETLDRIRLIRAALGIGFTVEELARILSKRDKGLVPCQQVHALALEKARLLEIRITQMQALRQALGAAIRGWGSKLRSTGPHKRAGLLEMFVASHPESPEAISPLISPGLRAKLERKRGATK